MFNFKILSELGEANVKVLAHKFFSSEGYQIDAYHKGQVEDILNLIGLNLLKLTSAGRNDLVKAYTRFSASDWRSILEKKSEKQKRLAQTDSVARMQALNQTAESKQYQDKLQKEVEDLKSDLTRDIISFLQLNPTKSLKDFDFSTYESVWKHLNHESDTETYTKSSFPNFLNAIDVYKQNIGTVNTPQAQPTVNPNDDSEGFGSFKWFVGGAAGLAAFFSAWTFFSQIGKSPKPIESSIKVGEANISKQEVKRLIDLLDELKIILIAEEGSVGDYALGVRNFDLTPAFLQYAETLQTIFISGAVDRETYARVTPHIMYFVKHQAEMPMAFSIHSKKFQIDSIEYKQDIKATHGYLSAIYLNLVVAEAIILTNPAEGAALVDLIFNVSFQKFTKVETILDNLEDNADLIEIKEKLGRLKKKAVHLKEKFERVR